MNPCRPLRRPGTRLASLALTLVVGVSLYGQGIKRPGSGGGTVTAGTGISVTGSEVSINSAVTATRDNVASGVDTYAVCTGSAGVETCTMSGNALAGFTTGGRVWTKFQNANTTTKTVQYGALAAKSVLRYDGTALAASDILAGVTYPLLYNGTAFLLPAVSSPIGTLVKRTIPLQTGIRDPVAGANYLSGIWSFTASGNSLDTQATSMWIGMQFKEATASASNIARAIFILPDDWSSTGPHSLYFSVSGGGGASTAGMTARLGCWALGVGPNASPSWGTESAVTAVSVPVSAVTGAASITSLTAPGACAAGLPMALELKRYPAHATDSSTDDVNVWTPRLLTTATITAP